MGWLKRSIGRKGGEGAEAAIGEQEIGNGAAGPACRMLVRTGLVQGSCYEGDGVSAELQGSSGAVLFTRVGRHWRSICFGAKAARTSNGADGRAGPLLNTLPTIANQCEPLSSQPWWRCTVRWLGLFSTWGTTQPPPSTLITLVPASLAKLSPRGNGSPCLPESVPITFVRPKSGNVGGLFPLCCQRCPLDLFLCA